MATENSAIPPNEIKETFEPFEEALSKLPPEVKMLLPESNLDYYKKTNEMHCDISKPGGSKFLEIPNILKVLEIDGKRIVNKLNERKDDRELFLNLGAEQSAFLPAVKNPGDPEGLPEALYYKVDGIKGKLGIIKIQELDPETSVIVRREKSIKDEQGKEKVPCSYSIIRETLENMPDSDFATVIIGREGGDQGRNEVWTIHPGTPIRTAQGDFLLGSENLSGPQQDVKQEVMIVKIKDLLDTGKMTDQDYVKIIIGKQEEILSRYKII